MYGHPTLDHLRRDMIPPSVYHTTAVTQSVEWYNNINKLALFQQLESSSHLPIEKQKDLTYNARQGPKAPPLDTSCMYFAPRPRQLAGAGSRV